MTKSVLKKKNIPTRNLHSTVKQQEKLSVTLFALQLILQFTFNLDPSYPFQHGLCSCAPLKYTHVDMAPHLPRPHHVRYSGNPVLALAYCYLVQGKCLAFHTAPLGCEIVRCSDCKPVVVCNPPGVVCVQEAPSCDKLCQEMDEHCKVEDRKCSDGSCHGWWIASFLILFLKNKHLSIKI